MHQSLSLNSSICIFIETESKGDNFGIHTNHSKYTHDSFSLPFNELANDACLQTPKGIFNDSTVVVLHSSDSLEMNLFNFAAYLW